MPSGCIRSRPGWIINLWDLVTEQLVAALRGHQAAIPDGAFSPDGRILATVSEDGMAKLWYGPDQPRALP